MTSSRPSFWRRLGLGLGTVPGTEEERRVFLQKRVSLYLGGLSLLWVLITVFGFGPALLFMPELLQAPQVSWVGAVHNLGMVGLVGLWLFARRGVRSVRTLAWLDAAVTVGNSFVMAAMMGGVDLRYRPDMSMTMGLSCALIGRAAVVPSSASRTAILGALAGAPLLVATSLAYGPEARERGLLAQGMVTAQIAMWLLFAEVLSVTVSRVIYGLSRRVEEAARLGQYTLEKRIGEGGMGVVYLARHALLRRPTAIKLLGRGRGGDQALERFEREVQATSSLRHPNTVAIYDYGRTPDGIFYYAMEYLDGIDLELLVRQDGPLPEGRVVHVLGQVARALAEAHAAGLIHRDVKPSNILVCEHGGQADFAKVLDFGLVKDVGGGDAAVSSVETLTGTPLYMSPESITAPSTLDARTDLYALGAVAYFLLTGSPPFTGSTVVEVCGHHLHSAPVPPSERRGAPVTPELEALVLCCLAKQPEARPATAHDFAARLAACPVTPWTDADAASWWRTRGAELRDLKRESAASTGGADTVPVDVEGRAGRWQPDGSRRLDARAPAR